MIKSMISLAEKDHLNVLGLMSGTSLDGLDLCFAEIRRVPDGIDARINAFSTIPYSPEFRAALVSLSNGDTETICHMNFEIGRVWTRMIRQFFTQIGKSEKEIDLIGSHGQTIWHIHSDSTLQIGEASLFAEEFGIPVVADFRVRDIAAGGSGAPLVPIVDYFLFKKYKKTLLILNLGGIANFTIVPSKAESVEDIYALDTGPGNSLIDLATGIYTNGKVNYDRDGKIAESGREIPEILAELMQHPYLISPLPKSTGREVFGINYLRQIINRFRIKQKDMPDLIATLTKFSAKAIHWNYMQFFPNRLLDEIIISGGGAKNPVLVNHLRRMFTNVPIRNVTEYGIDGDAKEAFAFAMLAALRIWEIPGNVPNTTGARRQVVLGKIIN
ncbi:MAG: anhydro-N-acetylmuramic acid kinase [Candidatus Marinimicrobia bacterium CG08_land_8_20_14_0_20_45_22]|nr:MAG: anhydro-N-acetylmuramic acid kinase [Candidatus Marinimicrobia bacterium CG08_land_8_20_14_0_20_45_22]